MDASDVIENQVGAHIANINGFDPDDDILTYSILSGQNSDFIPLNATDLNIKEFKLPDNN